MAQTQTTRLLHMGHLDIYSDPKLLRLTSIICTIGPSTMSPEKITELRTAGMNIVRLNFSHGSHEYHAQVVANARKSVEMYPGSPLGIALDTKGPEIRTGTVKQDIHLKAGQEITITTDPARSENGDSETIYVDYANLPHLVQVGQKVYIDDGLISVEVLSKEKISVRGRVLNSGTISSKKGVNLPQVDVDLPSVSEKDKADLKFGVQQKVDMIFASFIRRKEDVEEVRSILGEEGKNILIISKIENHQGIRNFQDILSVSDGIMVARGDLGIEIPPEKVFLAQKMMISRCNIAGKPIICATQMLESMTYNPRPTRAEVTDVANAVLDGADCVMLSGETAKGVYPVETVQIMDRICREAESAMYYGPFFNELRSITPKPTETSETLACSAVNAVLEQNAAAIIVLTTTGQSARLVSKYRPPCPIVTITRISQTSRQVHLHRGCVSLFYEKPPLADWDKDVEARLQWGIEYGKNAGFLALGDYVVTLQGSQSGSGYTNTMRLLPVS